MRTLLDKPCACWGVKLLSEITGKAIGTASNVKSFLKDRDWIEEHPRGFELKNTTDYSKGMVDAAYKLKHINSHSAMVLDEICHIADNFFNYIRL